MSIIARTVGTLIGKSISWMNTRQCVPVVSQLREYLILSDGYGITLNHCFTVMAATRRNFKEEKYAF
jgi:hypothetical protein